MAVQQHIRNPIEWGWDSLKQTGRAMNTAGQTLEGSWEGHDHTMPTVRRIDAADLRDALRKGFADFGAYRTDVIFLCLLYPAVGLILSRLIWGFGLLPLIFPLASGFALIAPFFAVGLYEMSRRRELGIDKGWADAFGVMQSPALGSIMALGLLLFTIFGLWLMAAHFIWLLTLGPDAPVSLGSFIRDLHVLRGRAHQSGADGAMGPDDRCRPGDRRDPAPAGAGDRVSRARARDVAPLSQTPAPTRLAA